MINEVCSTDATSIKNIGSKKQCLESPVKTPFVAKSTFAFATLADFRNKTKWLEAIEAKNIIPLPNVEGITTSNTDPVRRTGRFTDYTLKDGVRGTTYRFDIAVCTYEALITYENSDYTRVFRATTKDEVTCDVQDDGSVKGENLSSLLVGLRSDATDDDVPFVNVDLKYESKVFDILKPGFAVTELEGINDITVEITSAAAGEIKFKTIDKCSNATKTNFVGGDIVVLDAAGDAFAVSFVAADANGDYTITPSVGNFANDFTIDLDGVIQQADMFYESTGPATVTGIA